MKLLFVLAVILMDINQIHLGNSLQMYFQQTKLKTWDEAYSGCLEIGMELATLNSQADYDAAKALITSSTTGQNNAKHVWIGYHVDFSTQQFKWINGENSTFEEWIPGDPDMTGYPICVRLKHTEHYQFSDFDCSKQYYYLCTGGSAPVVTVNNNTRRVTIGSSTHVKCKFISLWDVTVEWINTTDNTTVIDNGEPILYAVSTSFIKGQLSHSKLIFTSVNEKDLGTYICRVENQFGVGFSKNNFVIKKKVFYLESNDVETWDNAVLQCRDRNMELATLDSLADHLMAMNYIIDTGTTVNQIWIGMYGDVTTFIFYWINDIQPTYFDWSPGEPGWITSNKNCVQLDSTHNYKFEDHRCTGRFNYLCNEGTVPIVYTPETTITAPVTSTIILDCQYKSLWNITNVIWQKKTMNETFILDQSKDSNIYSGGTNDNSSLVINRMKIDNGGIYRCFVENRFGIGRGLDIFVSVQPGPPVLEPGTTTFAVNKSDSVTFNCNAEAFPSISNVTWTKEVDGVMTIIESVQMSFVFTISSVNVRDTGRFICHVTNVLGSTKRIFQLDVAEELKHHLCKCNCWALNNKNNYTIEELKDALSHVTKKLRKDLLIDTTVLSSTINRRISKNDDRPSSKHIGYVGITVLCVVICAIVLADLTSLPTLVLMVKATHNHR